MKADDASAYPVDGKEKLVVVVISSTEESDTIIQVPITVTAARSLLHRLNDSLYRLGEKV